MIQVHNKFYRPQLIIIMTGWPQIKMSQITKSKKLALGKPLFPYLRIGIAAEFKPSHSWFESSLPNKLLGGKDLAWTGVLLGRLRRLE